MIDIKKVITTPQNEWQAIDAMIKAEQHLLSALHILESIIENNGEEYRELHEKRIKEFLQQFELDPKPQLRIMITI